MASRQHAAGQPLDEFDTSPYDDMPRRRRARPAIASDVRPSPRVGKSSSRRRLTEQERRAIRERRNPPALELPPEPAPRAEENDGGPGPVTGRGAVGGRALMLGGLLFLGMAVVAFVPATLLRGGGGDDSTPVPTVAVTSAAPVAATPIANPTAVPSPTPVPLPSATAPSAGAETSAATSVVCLDPGHGGWDLGWARDRAPGLTEAEMNLVLALQLRDRLEEQGIGVVMTRESGVAANAFDEDVNQDGLTVADAPEDRDIDELQARINVCNAAEADLLLSMHLNGVTDESAQGYEVWYTAAPTRPFGRQSEWFATTVYWELEAQFSQAGFDTVARGIHDDASANVDVHNIETANDHYIMTGPADPGPAGRITPSEMPGAIVEPLFLSNDADAGFLASEEGQEALVTAYANAIIEYFEEFPGS